MRKINVGIGIDIESISRFEELPFENNKSFYRRIFTDEEIAYCLGKSTPCQHFAVRFCAKEAFIKAYERKVDSYNNIKVSFNNGKPSVIWENIKAKLSASHTKGLAIAVVVILK